MDKVRILDRRSFLARVTGASLAFGAALVVGGQAVEARRRRMQMAIDADPRDPARPIDAGGTPRPPARPRPADTDSGRNADTAGYGRPAQAGRFILCPGNRRCPGRNR